jgi:hypothetical protein
MILSEIEMDILNFVLLLEWTVHSILGKRMDAVSVIP